jgi:hypothetical protein
MGAWYSTQSQRFIFCRGMQKNLHTDLIGDQTEIPLNGSPVSYLEPTRSPNFQHLVTGIACSKILLTCWKVKKLQFLGSAFLFLVLTGLIEHVVQKKYCRVCVCVCVCVKPIGNLGHFQLIKRSNKIPTCHTQDCSYLWYGMLCRLPR